MKRKKRGNPESTCGFDNRKGTTDSLSIVAVLVTDCLGPLSLLLLLVAVKVTEGGGGSKA